MESNIVNNEAAKLAYEIAGYSHKSVEQVVAQAIRELAERVLPYPLPPAPKIVDEPPPDWSTFRKRIAEIQNRVAALPVLDDRTPEEIIGYDEHGLPPQ